MTKDLLMREAKSLAQKGSHQEAINKLNELLEYDNACLAHYYKGLSLAALKEHGNAITSYEQAINATGWFDKSSDKEKIWRANCLSHIKKAIELFTRRDYKFAIEICKKMQNQSIFGNTTFAFFGHLIEANIHLSYHNDESALKSFCLANQYSSTVLYYPGKIHESLMASDLYKFAFRDISLTDIFLYPELGEKFARATLQLESNSCHDALNSCIELEKIQTILAVPMDIKTREYVSLLEKNIINALKQIPVNSAKYAESQYTLHLCAESKQKNIKAFPDYIANLYQSSQYLISAYIADHKKAKEKLSGKKYQSVSIKQVETVHYLVEKELNAISESHPFYQDAQFSLFQIYYIAYRDCTIYQNFETRFSDIRKSFEYLIRSKNEEVIESFELKDYKELNSSVFRALGKELNNLNGDIQQLYRIQPNQTMNDLKHILPEIKLEEPINHSLSASAPSKNRQELNSLGHNNYRIEITDQLLKSIKDVLCFTDKKTGEEVFRLEPLPKGLLLKGHGSHLKLEFKTFHAVENLIIHNPGSKIVLVSKEEIHFQFLSIDASEFVCEFNLESDHHFLLQTTGRLIQPRDHHFKTKGQLELKCKEGTLEGMTSSGTELFLTTSDTLEIKNTSLLHAKSSAKIKATTLKEMGGKVFSKGTLTVNVNNISMNGQALFLGEKLVVEGDNLMMNGRSVLNTESNAEINIKEKCIIEKYCSVFAPGTLTLGKRTAPIKELLNYGTINEKKIVAFVSLFRNFKNAKLDSETTICWNGDHFWNAGDILFGERENENEPQTYFKINYLFVLGIAQISDIWSVPTSNEAFQQFLNRPTFGRGNHNASIVAGLYLNLFTIDNVHDLNLTCLAEFNFLGISSASNRNKTRLAHLDFSFDLPNIPAMLSDVSDVVKQISNGEYAAALKSLCTKNTFFRTTSIVRSVVNRIIPVAGKVVNSLWAFTMLLLNSKQLATDLYRLYKQEHPIELSDITSLLNYANGIALQGMAFHSQDSWIWDGIGEVKVNMPSLSEIPELAASIVAPYFLPSTNDQSGIGWQGGVHINGSETDTTGWKWTSKCNLTLAISYTDTFYSSYYKGTECAYSVSEYGVNSESKGKTVARTFSRNVDNSKEEEKVNATYFYDETKTLDQSKKNEVKAEVAIVHAETGKPNGQFKTTQLEFKIDDLKSEDVQKILEDKKKYEVKEFLSVETKEAVTIPKYSKISRECSISVTSAATTVAGDMKSSETVILKSTKGNTTVSGEIDAKQIVRLAENGKNIVTETGKLNATGKIISADEKGHENHGNINSGDQVFAFSEKGESLNDGKIKAEHNVTIINKEGKVINSVTVKYVPGPYGDTMGQYTPGKIEGGDGVGYNNVGVNVYGKEAVQDGEVTAEAKADIIYVGDEKVESNPHVDPMFHITYKSVESDFWGDHTKIIEGKNNSTPVFATKGKVIIQSPNRTVSLCATIVYAEAGQDIHGKYDTRFPALIIETRRSDDFDNTFSSSHDTETHQTSQPPILDSSNGDIKISSEKGNIESQSIICTRNGKLIINIAPGQSAIFDVPILNHSFTEESTTLEFNVPFITTIEALTEGDVARAIPLMGDVKSDNKLAAANAISDANKVVTGMRENGSLKNAMPGLSTDTVSVGISHTKATSHYQTLGASGIYAKDFEFNGKGGTLEIKGVPVTVTGNAKIEAEHFIQEGKELNSSFDSKSETASLSFSQNGMVGASAGFNESHGEAKEIVQQKFKVGGTTTLNVEDYKQTDAILETGKANGTVKNFESKSTPSTSHTHNVSAHISTGDVGYSESSSEEKNIVESGIYSKEKGDLKISHAELKNSELKNVDADEVKKTNDPLHQSSENNQTYQLDIPTQKDLNDFKENAGWVKNKLSGETDSLPRDLSRQTQDEIFAEEEHKKVPEPQKPSDGLKHLVRGPIHFDQSDDSDNSNQDEKKLTLFSNPLVDMAVDTAKREHPYEYAVASGVTRAIVDTASSVINFVDDVFTLDHPHSDAEYQEALGRMETRWDNVKNTAAYIAYSDLDQVGDDLRKGYDYFSNESWPERVETIAYGITTFTFPYVSYRAFKLAETQLFNPWSHTPEFSISYRGDAGNINDIFKNGREARGINPNLISHVVPPDGKPFFSESAYVSTSRSLDIAATFPKPLPGGVEYVHVYEIHSIRENIDIADALSRTVFRGKMSHEEVKIYWDTEQERAFPGKILPHEIKGAWKVDLQKRMALDPKKLEHLSEEDINEICYRTDRKIQESFIPNPNYIPPQYHERLQRNANIRPNTKPYMIIGAANTNASYEDEKTVQIKNVNVSALRNSFWNSKQSQPPIVTPYEPNQLNRWITAKNA